MGEDEAAYCREHSAAHYLDLPNVTRHPGSKRRPNGGHTMRRNAQAKRSRRESRR